MNILLADGATTTIFNRNSYKVVPGVYVGKIIEYPIEDDPIIHRTVLVYVDPNNNSNVVEIRLNNTIEPYVSATGTFDGINAVVYSNSSYYGVVNAGGAVYQ